MCAYDGKALQERKESAQIQAVHVHQVERLLGEYSPQDLLEVRGVVPVKCEYASTEQAADMVCDVTKSIPMLWQRNYFDRSEPAHSLNIVQPLVQRSDDSLAIEAESGDVERLR